MPSEPTDDELIAFADSVLRGVGDAFLDSDLLRETVAEHRDLWCDLYRISRGEPPTASASQKSP